MKIAKISNPDTSKNTFMREPITNDNLFRVGTLIKAKEGPDLQLKIMSYNQRIYYCGIVSDPKSKELAYYERELIPPVLTDSFHV